MDNFILGVVSGVIFTVIINLVLIKIKWILIYPEEVTRWIIWIRKSAISIANNFLVVVKLRKAPRIRPIPTVDQLYMYKNMYETESQKILSMTEKEYDSTKLIHSQEMAEYIDNYKKNTPEIGKKIVDRGWRLKAISAVLLDYATPADEELIKYFATFLMIEFEILVLPRLYEEMIIQY